jgi:cytochrome c554/c'-like protein
MTARRWGGSIAAMILLVATWQGVGSGVTPGDLPIRSTMPSRIPAALVLRPQGAGSCAAAACHGSMGPATLDAYPSRVLRNEYSTWVTQDRHANAYQVLFSNRSRRMATLLSGGNVPAHRDARCLACHSTTGTDPLATTPEVVRQDGVGCESCHGPAERWLGAHTQLGWIGLSAEAKESQYGMRATRALDRRAAICVECHVGGPGREVNHDLIAAGHPRLNFEFAAYLANMPPHWVEDTRGNFPAQVWAIGQAATARAALEQLHTRALQARSRSKAPRDEHATASPWPEFSEYDCFSCHHDLADEKWRKQRIDSGLTPGTPPWGTWYYPMMLTLAGSDPRPEARELEAHFSTLRDEMSRFNADPGKVASETQELTEALSRWLRVLPAESRSYDASKIKDLLKTVEKGDARGGATGWDAAAQSYLALQPLRQALKDLDPQWNDARLYGKLGTLFEKLKFPKGFDSPSRFEPANLGGDR